MKTEFEIASIIRNYVSSHEGVTDFPVTLKQISDEVDTLRVRLMEELDTKGLFRKPFFNFTQVLKFGGTDEPKVHLDSVTRARYIEIPRLFFRPSTNKPAIAYIGASNGKEHYRVVTGLQREWHTADRWIGRAPTAIVIENDNNEGYRIELKNISSNRLRLVAVFEDPSDMEGINGYDGSKTSSEGGTLYPTPSGQVDIMIGKTVESYIRTLYRTAVQGNQTVDAPKQTKPVA